VTAGVLGLLAALVAATPATGCSWRVALRVPVAPAAVGGHVWDVSATSSSDVWAGGHEVVRVAVGTMRQTPLLAHWDGRHWRVARSPVRYGSVVALAAVSQHEAWAIVQSAPRLRLLHWDGTRWARVPMPAGVGHGAGLVRDGAGTLWLTGTRLYTWSSRHWRPVDAVGRTSSDVRIVVSRESGELWRIESSPTHATPPVVDHWTGSRWERTALRAGRRVDFAGLVARSPSDAWLAGSDGAHALLYRWDGRSWRRVVGPPHGAIDADVSAVGRRGVWLSGSTADPSVTVFPPYLRRWDGAHWKTSTSPTAVDSDQMTLYRVGARGTWATTLLKGDVYRLVCAR
jgi:hypothetical protein